MNIAKCQQNISIDSMVMGILDENNPLMLDLLNILIFESKYKYRVYVTQSYLADKLGTSREWVNKLLRKWKQLGAINYRQIGYNLPCLYLFNPLLIKERLRLLWKLPALRVVFCVSSLCISVFNGSFTLNNIRNIPIWKMVTFPGIDYGFYESREAERTVFLKNEQQTTPYSTITSKERVMNAQQAVINLISSTYGLSQQQEEMLSSYSDEALQYAVTEMVRQKVKPNNPVNWLAAVARKQQEKASQPKTGRMENYAKKIVNGTFNANHSPARQQPVMSDNDRIAFLTKEIASFKDKIANPEKYFLPNVDIEHAMQVGRSMLAAREQELADLLSPAAKIIDKPDGNMSPAEWLLWNRERKIQRLKESDAK